MKRLEIKPFRRCGICTEVSVSKYFCFHYSRARPTNVSAIHRITVQYRGSRSCFSNYRSSSNNARECSHGHRQPLNDFEIDGLEYSRGRQYNRQICGGSDIDCTIQRIRDEGGKYQRSKSSTLVC